MFAALSSHLLSPTLLRLKRVVSTICAEGVPARVAMHEQRQSSVDSETMRMGRDRSESESEVEREMSLAVDEQW